MPKSDRLGNLGRGGL